MRTSTADYYFLRWISGLPVQREMIESVAYLYNFAEDIPGVVGLVKMVQD